jgi:hypothetical protein
VMCALTTNQSEYVAAVTLRRTLEFQRGRVKSLTGRAGLWGIFDRVIRAVLPTYHPKKWLPPPHATNVEVHEDDGPQPNCCHRALFVRRVRQRRATDPAGMQSRVQGRDCCRWLRSGSQLGWLSRKDMRNCAAAAPTEILRLGFS